MRESYIFYRSLLDAIDDLEDETAGQIVKAVSHYAMDDITPELTGISKAVFALIKPQIDANNRKYENGKKGKEYGKLGGRPKTPRKPQENPKKTPSEPQENPKETPKEKKEPYGLNGNVKLTEIEFNKLVNDFGDAATGEAIQFLDDYIADKNYKSKSNYSALRRWVFDAVKEQKQKQKKIQSIDEKQTADDWFKQRGFV